MERNLISNYKIGIFGGAFDPIHIGHHIIANIAVDDLQLDKLFIVPTYISPFKWKEGENDSSFRMDILKKVFKDSKKIEISDFEIKKRDISYSIDTINHFSQSCKGELFLIIGEDNLYSFNKWRNSEEILKKVKLAVFPRKVENYRKINISHKFINSPQIDISSSLIRQRIKEGKTIKGMVPQTIYKEVMEHYGE